MAVSYIEPAERAWARTRSILFRPFDVERWAVIGFVAFLAFVAGQWAGISFTPRWRFGFPPDWGNLVEAPFEHLLEAVRGSTWFLFGIPFAVATLAISVALLWLSSRGKLVFLDNMVRGRAALVAPWKRYGRIGDSLFMWRAGFCLATLLIAAVGLWPLFLAGLSLSDTGLGRPFGILVSFGVGAVAMILGAAVAYTALFLESFVIPLMLRREETAMEAWRRFLPLLKNHLPEFLVYGLVVLLAGVAVFLCLIAAGLATCCVLPVLLSIPYVRSVLLLPVTGFFRLYSVEFLRQFGEEYALPPEGTETSPGPTEPPAPPSGDADAPAD